MGLTAMFVGSVSGFGMQMMNNALQKVPLSRKPWLHVTYFFVGGYIGQRWVRLERDLVLDINEIRADKGMPPMVATDAMLGLHYKLRTSKQN
mmetsp:Transcript_9467/g.17127  ORF Transcript_9467/g.17127 Transcript_9467/m.17127 type:complete len:92 (-) Transcript_9467:107-382(-)|eukprot:CAMPEP_0201869460 /NCGR_PEP_ID=MMETSP0902-20130614/2974_1 /ASSEMBLY_ACC=CAM_ASM_000551 /TAXON_ID=420261 /ORGANISM="Thalassiosira antarctica, Strain CCMP982" /LENGTH=91 /DNA_ID=CAMNT_0048394977 /DNA_START=136 /DNA_END=411 /DNA_ORIENTATION=-